MQKRTVQETQLRPASSATVTFVVRAKLTFTPPSWLNNN